MDVLTMQLRSLTREKSKDGLFQMALFESYERRIDKINEVLNSYGIASSKKLRRSQRMPVLMYTTDQEDSANLF